jgi:hypothetical protein
MLILVRGATTMLSGAAFTCADESMKFTKSRVRTRPGDFPE